MHLIEIDHRSQSSFHHFFLTEEQRFLLAIGLRYGGDFVFENAGDGAEVCSTGFLFWVLQFGSLSFWNPFGNILEREMLRGRKEWVFCKHLRGKKSTLVFHFLERQLCGGEPFDASMLWGTSRGGWELLLLPWRRGEIFPTSLTMTIPGLLRKVMSPI